MLVLRWGPLWGLKEVKKSELKIIQELTEEMAKLASRIENDLLSTLVGLSGSLKDIECGTHIKIPMGVGYVNYYKSQDSESISMWLKHELLLKLMEEKRMNHNVDEDGYIDK